MSTIHHLMPHSFQSCCTFLFNQVGLPCWPERDNLPQTSILFITVNTRISQGHTIFWKIGCTLNSIDVSV